MLALTMIVKSSDDEMVLLQNCLESIHKHVDGIFITFNGQEDKPTKNTTGRMAKVVKKYGAVVDYTKWTGSFAQMRLHNLAQVPKSFDWILWLDTDDTVDKPEKIKDLLAKADKLDGIMATYDYASDGFGNVTTEHINCRIFKNNGVIMWPEASSLHETPTETRRAQRAYTTDFKVVHHSDDSRMNRATLRNITIMEEMLEHEGDTPDPRTLYYLGTAYIDAGDIERATELLELYITMSGWDEEVAQAHVWLGRMKRDQGDILSAHSHFLEALWQNPKEISAQVELGATEMELKHWSKAIVWLEQAVVMKPSPTAIVTNPMERTYKAYMLLAQCHLQMGASNIDTALKFANLAHKLRPDATTTEFRDMLQSIVKEKNTVQSFINAVKQIDAVKAERAYAKLDESYRSNPAVIGAMRLHRPPKTWEKKSIAIYCGSSVLKDWGPWSLESGIGGSEEAVIRISKHLNDMGWKVTVYSNPGIKDGTHDGVVWKNYWEIDLRDTFDVFIAWRAPEFFDIKVDARKTYCWMHDVMDDADFTPERLANMTKVMLLSKYHKSVYPSIPDDKVFYTGNGIDPAEFEEWDGKIERNPKQVIYQSSHVRGLDTLCDVWENVIKEVPDAKLTVAYGWQSYDEINRNNPERMAWKDNLVKRMDDLGIVDLGRVGQDEIVKMIQGAGVWAYPTQFCEIYCITAVKAQAGGAWPVCTDFAALAEVVNFGDTQHMEAIDDKTPIGKWQEGGIEKYTKDLIFRLKNPIPEVTRKIMMINTRENYSWKTTAGGWDAEFNS